MLIIYIAGVWADIYQKKILNRMMIIGLKKKKNIGDEDKTGYMFQEELIQWFHYVKVF